MVQDRLTKIASKQTVRLTHYGRKSGKPYAVTIWFAVEGNHVFIGTANVDRQWVRNVRNIPKVKLLIGDETFEGEARFLSDRAEHERAQATMRKKYWMYWPILTIARLLMMIGLVRDKTASFQVTLCDVKALNEPSTNLVQQGGIMAVQHVSLETIEDFLNQERVALVGLSRDPAGFSLKLFEELCRRGYDVVPVNPNTADMQGRRCYARVQDIQPPVDGAILMTSPATTDTIVRDCAEAGIRRVWMYRAAGKGAVSPRAVKFCEERGIQVVPGQCPFMFWPDAATGHRVHGFIRKITGRYPRRVPTSDRRAA
jgi:deazaflavin-dependent oxidoreductase (nitroreductase family)